MAGLSIQYADGLCLPDLNLWLDPHEPHTGPERVFVSHAHSDHVAAHREVILSEPTARLMQVRLPGVRQEHVLPFGAKRRFGEGTAAFDLTLLPAGHIFGSAMALVEARGESLLYTGDFKLRRGLSAEACEPRPADLLVMETTFGRPQYRFPPATEVLEGIVRFCREALENDQTAVLFGYSLGKSQELLCSLGDAGLPLMLHGAVWRLTELYKEFGHCFPPYARYDAGSAAGKVLLCPPNVINSAMLRKLSGVRTAILTGWALDPNCRYRYQCDAAFPLSDHADFPELLQLVQLVHPRRVYTVHGFAVDFAQTLREQGYDARALSHTEQLGLPLAVSMGKMLHAPSKATDMPHPPAEAVLSVSLAASSFEEFALTCAQIAAVAGKLEKIRLLADYLRRLDSRTAGTVTMWFAGRPFPANQNRVLQVGWAVIRDAVCAVASCDEMAFHQVYLKHSDLGSTAEEMLLARRGMGGPTVRDVQNLFERLQVARGPLAKMPVLASALGACSPLSAKYLVKIITGDLRIGLKEGLVEQALGAAFGCTEEQVRHANLLLGDIGETARLAAENGLEHVEMMAFRPIKFMLASPEPSAEAIWERLLERRTSEAPLEGKLEAGASGPNQTAVQPVTAWLEDKYDGIRAQLHKVGERVEFFSRDLKEITATFAELADSVRRLQPDMILDGEIVAMRGEKVLPFAELQKRLGRRQRDLFMREEVPVVFMAFDLLWLNGDTLLDTPLRERRRKLESLASLPQTLQLARITRVASPAEVDAAFDSARARGNEGLMSKDPLSVYTPGRQGLAWLKLKKAFATLDCVVIGAEYGHGKRSKVLSDYTFAVRDEDTDELVTIGKAYTGLTDREIAGLTEKFLRTAISQHGRYFEIPPDTVLEIAFDRIQPSTRHNSGLALRFPRIVRLRTDKAVADIDTLSTARRLAGVSTGQLTPITARGKSA